MISLLVLATLAVYGYDYYSAPQVEQIYDPMHAELKPSGRIGLRIGMFGGVMFLLIYLYPLRKRWARLRSVGSTRHWLDFHILMGVAAPLLITLHSSFRFHGIAGMAFWIMWAVAASGFVGRYFYGQIPRRLSAAEMNLREMESVREHLSEELQGQRIFTAADLEPLFDGPSREEVQQMSPLGALRAMASLDLRRLILVSRLRRKATPPAKRLLTLGGLLPLGNAELERVIRTVRGQAWLSAKILFLEKTQQVFHLWHLVHRPFSYSFAVLVVIHVIFVVSLGYY